MKELHLTTDELREIAHEIDMAYTRVGIQVKIRNCTVVLERTSTGWIFVQPLDMHLVIHGEDEN
jgi:hypothetical protein